MLRKWIGLLALSVYLIFTGPNPAHAQSGLSRFDNGVLANLETRRTEGATRTLRFIADINNGVNIAVPVGLLTAGLIRNDAQMKRDAGYIASSSAITALFNFAIKRIVKRPRPFITNIHLTPVYRAGDYSFPSGHTSLSFSTATALVRSYPKWYVIVPSFAWAATVGYSRMYLGVHYPTDVAAGAMLGTGMAFATGFIRR
ncbi:PAP2 family protein [Deminuibacter soli]|uniref:PAP2 family protein n=2 Tax=Deminuibacter soli TaxID=2291815 RepID=A0A3E1NMZ8_9BACT|nr:PAP2 family protein [Deminuibacter soli]